MKTKLTAKRLRQLYFDFFVDRGHRVIPGSPLIPEGDSSTLFISAGMHPLVPYLLGEPHPLGKRLVNVQECLRTGDIASVGDSYHHTWFEMLGNWSLGDYFKKEAIEWSFQFLTQVLKLPASQLAVTCFAGEGKLPRDDFSAKVWKNLGIPQERIFFKPKKDNWWGPVGETGPCGPDTEMFFDNGQKKCSPSCSPGCSCGKYIEVWNDVFMEYYQDEKGRVTPLRQKNVDTGMGVERVLRVVNGFDDDYQTDVWRRVIVRLEEISRKSYQKKENQRPMRIIADHLRAAVFVLADGVVPSNKEQGYILRRLIRRSIRQGRALGIEKGLVVPVAKAIIANQENYAGDYPELKKEKENILFQLEEEERKFNRTLARGLRELAKLVDSLKRKGEKTLPGKTAFFLYETFGFPLELIEEEVGEEGITVDRQGFEEEEEKHRQRSRQSAAGRFKGGLGDVSQETIAHHTATHLLHQALRQILGDHVFQAGSAITGEKLRFDFTHPRPLTAEEKIKIERLVNQKIKENLPVKMEVMSFSEAKKRGALAFFQDRYPPRVKVYSIGDFSREICGGPHVRSTGELGRFKILKEESCGGGKRRIYARLEKKNK